MIQCFGSAGSFWYPYGGGPKGSPLLPPDFVADSLFLRDVPRIPFVKQISDRGQLVVALAGVNAVRDGNEPNVMRGKEFLHEPANLDVVSPEPGEVLHKDGSGVIGFQLGLHCLVAGSVHGHAGYAVVGKGYEVRKALVLRCLGQQLFLICDAVALAIQIARFFRC